MSIELNPEEAVLRNEIADRVGKARDAFAESWVDESVSAAITEAGERAHRLHLLLKARGLEPKHHAYMIRNRELQPDHPEFYMQFHAIEDLLKFLDDPNANNDPVDKTIGSEFVFRVYSRRWGHDDTYRIIRTSDGWDINHSSIGGPCDKGGKPFLFANFKQDYISFPDGLDGWLEWLWSKASENGMTGEQVQNALQQIADWVSETERRAPSGGVWTGY